MDDLVLRDCGMQRLYAMHDYFNCTAIADATGTVLERYGYNGFGQARFMTPSFGIQTGSSYGWETLFTNYRSDSETGFYQIRYRYKHHGLGRWLTRDPLHEPGFGLRDRMRLNTGSKWPSTERIDEKAGLNLYEVLGNDLIARFDILGLAGISKDGRGITVIVVETNEIVWWASHGNANNPRFYFPNPQQNSAAGAMCCEASQINERIGMQPRGTLIPGSPSGNPWDGPVNPTRNAYEWNLAKANMNAGVQQLINSWLAGGATSVKFTGIDSNGTVTTVTITTNQATPYNYSP